jgi:hypothetical protein
MVLDARPTFGDRLRWAHWVRHSLRGGGRKADAKRQLVADWRFRVERPGDDQHPDHNRDQSPMATTFRHWWRAPLA